MSEGKVIEFVGVSMTFGDTPAVEDLTARVEPGRVTAFLGPNGAGKTTTLRMLLGDLRATSGTATIGGTEYTRIAKPATSIGAVMSIAPLERARRKTTMKYLTRAARRVGVGASRAREVLAIVGLAEMGEMRIGSLSLGMKHRLAVAEALLGDPSVLVFDEPANGLDPEGIRWIRLLMRGFADEGRTVLMSSHLLSEVEQVADSLLILNEGRLLFEGPIELLGEAEGGTVTVDADDRAALEKALRAAGFEYRVLRSGLAIDDTTTSEIGSLAKAAGIALTTLTHRGPTLEDVYLQIIDGSWVAPARTAALAPRTFDEVLAGVSLEEGASTAAAGGAGALGGIGAAAAGSAGAAEAGLAGATGAAAAGIAGVAGAGMAAGLAGGAGAEHSGDGADVAAGEEDSIAEAELVNADDAEAPADDAASADNAADADELANDDTTPGASTADEAGGVSESDADEATTDADGSSATTAGAGSAPAADDESDPAEASNGDSAETRAPMFESFPTASFAVIGSEAQASPTADAPMGFPAASFPTPLSSAGSFSATPADALTSATIASVAAYEGLGSRSADSAASDPAVREGGVSEGGVSEGDVTSDLSHSDASDSAALESEVSESSATESDATDAWDSDAAPKSDDDIIHATIDNDFDDDFDDVPADLPGSRRGPGAGALYGGALPGLAGLAGLAHGLRSDDEDVDEELPEGLVSPGLAAAFARAGEIESQMSDVEADIEAQESRAENIDLEATFEAMGDPRGGAEMAQTIEIDPFPGEGLDGADGDGD